MVNEPPALLHSAKESSSSLDPLVPEEEEGARARARQQLPVLAMAKHGSSPRRRPGLDRANTATGRRHGFRVVVVIAFKSRGARRARFSPRGVSADRAQSTSRAVRTWRGCVVSQRGVRFSPRRWPGSTAPTTQQVGDTGFKGCEYRVRILWRVVRAFTSHHERVTKESSLSLAQGASVGRKPTTTSAARHERAACSSVAPPP